MQLRVKPTAYSGQTYRFFVDKGAPLVHIRVRPTELFVSDLLSCSCQTYRVRVRPTGFVSDLPMEKWFLGLYKYFMQKNRNRTIEEINKEITEL
jgi:hypothetical protein